jgi:repressor LexA
MSLGNRLAAVLRKLELTQTALAKRLGISNVVINRYIKDKTMPDYNFLNKLAAVFSININWLITGDGIMFSSESIRQIGDRTYFNVPIVAQVSCGSPEEIAQAEIEDQVLIDTVSLSGDFSRYFAFYANGDSMDPYISHGDVVIVKQQEEWDNADDRVCVVRVDHEVTLKKVSLFSEGGKILLSPFNKEHSPIILEEDLLEKSHLVGVAVMALKNL